MKAAHMSGLHYYLEIYQPPVPKLNPMLGPPP
jgi:hypothetical protein